MDPWQDPYHAEVLDNTRPQPSPRADFTGEKRSMLQTWTYDWLGNTVESDDDKHAFYDRSLGTIGQGPTNNTGPYQLQSADNASKGGSRTGSLEAQYDPSGNLIWLDVRRQGPCIPEGKCNRQQFAYEWDEVGRLVKAQRWDEVRSGQRADTELQFAYDASDARVRKTVVVGLEARHDVYLFDSLELRLAEWLGTGYDVNDETEVAYLMGHGVRLARVVNTLDPGLGTKSTRVFLELGDHLGSTSVVLDRATGELVERSTAYAYGAPESDYRPGRWQSFREDYRFTGKEDDIEVGLVYFGARYLNPLLGRWISADPLAVHAPGKADLNLYAYVHGRVLSAVDPVGLADSGSSEGSPGAPTTAQKINWSSILGNFLAKPDGADSAPTGSSGTGTQQGTGAEQQPKSGTGGSSAGGPIPQVGVKAGTRGTAQGADATPEVHSWKDIGEGAVLRTGAQTEKDLGKISYFAAAAAGGPTTVVIAVAVYWATSTPNHDKEGIGPIAEGGAALLLAMQGNTAQSKAETKIPPKPSPQFEPPTNPAQHPPATLPEGHSVRVMPATQQYPNGYWVQTNAGNQPINPATGKPPSNVTRPQARAQTHVPLPPKE